MGRNLLRFDSFIEDYLYGKNGYYSKSALKPGSDYITAPQVSEEYAKFISAFSSIKACELNFSRNWIFVDIGSGFGEIALSFSKMFPQTSCIAVEASEVRRKIIEDKGKHLCNLKVVESLEEVPKDKEVFVVANEFFDALPVRVFKKKGERLYELFVDEKSKEPVFVVANEEQIPEIVLKYSKVIPQGYLLEYEEKAANTIELLSRFEKIFLLLIDYGYRFEEIERFSSGTLVGFSSHRFLNNVLDRLQDNEKFDLTHQVNFSFLIEVAKKHGLKTVLYLSLGRFIINNAEILKGTLSKDELTNLYRLVLPHRFGDSFKVVGITNI